MGFLDSLKKMFGSKKEEAAPPVAQPQTSVPENQSAPEPESQTNQQQ